MVSKMTSSQGAARRQRSGMKLCRVVLILLIGATPTSLLAQQSTYDTELHLGVQAYKEAKYEEAIPHFKLATVAAPEQLKAHLYLATAYAQQYIPGADLPENTENAEAAIGEYEKVLVLNPPQDAELTAVKGMASLYLNMKKFDLARQNNLTAAKLDPDNPETYYTLGVIDWMEAYQLRMEGRAKLNLKPGMPMIHQQVCWNIRSANQDRVNDGIEMLTKALSLRHDYSDAMAYMNLMYRERADIQCGNLTAYNADRGTADKWVDLTLATKKQKAEAKHRTPQEP